MYRKWYAYNEGKNSALISIVVLISDWRDSRSEKCL